MRTYGQYCPIARAAEVLGDRWTLLIVREMSFGVRHFNELERCLPGISRSVLAQRLRQMIGAGLVRKDDGGAGRASEYALTEAGLSLKPVLLSLGEWAAAWAFADPRPDELNPDLVMRWISRHVAQDNLPAGRTVIQFEVTSPRRRYWLVLQPDEVSVCLHHPGFETDLVVKASTATLFDVYLGRVTVGEAMAVEALRLDGSPKLVRQFPGWFAWSHFAPTVRAHFSPAGVR
jgi:DNA-binding HxlR family transcriptional regulator